MTANGIDVVKAFVAAINRQNCAGISDLMTEDHTFVGSAGRLESGRQNVTVGWREYFRIFPDQTILVETIVAERGLADPCGNTILLDQQG